MVKAFPPQFIHLHLPIFIASFLLFSYQSLSSDLPSRLALSRGLRSWGGLPELEGALPREEAPRSVVAVVTLEVGGPGWGALRTQG